MVGSANYKIGSAYRHYIGGSGTDLHVNYSKFYKEDKPGQVQVDNEIAAA